MPGCAILLFMARVVRSVACTVCDVRHKYVCNSVCKIAADSIHTYIHTVVGCIHAYKYQLNCQGDVHCNLPLQSREYVLCCTCYVGGCGLADVDQNIRTTYVPRGMYYTISDLCSTEEGGLGSQWNKKILKKNFLLLFHQSLV